MMRSGNSTRDVAIGVAVGTVATLACTTFGSFVVTSGWTSGVCAVTLAACSAGLVAWRFMRPSEADRSPALSPPPFIDASSVRWGQSMKPAAWLEREGAMAVPDKGLETFLSSRLGRSLRSLPEQRGGHLVERPLFNDRAIDLLLLVFAVHHLGVRSDGRPKSTRLLEDLARAHFHPPGDAREAALDRIRDGIAPHLASGGHLCALLDQAWTRHGTCESLALGLLGTARKRRGVLAPAEFLWLKGVDRDLWYALNNLGRRDGFHVEGLAAMDHLRSELQANEPFRLPRVEQAAESLAALARTMRAGLAPA